MFRHLGRTGHYSRALCHAKNLTQGPDLLFYARTLVLILCLWVPNMALPYFRW